MNPSEFASEFESLIRNKEYENACKLARIYSVLVGKSRVDSDIGPIIFDVIKKTNDQAFKDYVCRVWEYPSIVISPFDKTFQDCVVKSETTA